MSETRSRHVRLLLLACLLLITAGLLWLLFGAANSALLLWRELRALPPWLGVLIGLLVGVVLAASAWIGWRLLHPRPRQPKPARMPDRSSITQRVDALALARADTIELEAELRELDQRRRSGECYVAVFGEISTGKSSLIRALSGNTAIVTDVLGGTTRAIAHHAGLMDDGRQLVLADVPGTQEIDATQREQIARDEALRAHAVIYVTAGDLSRQQDVELRWLHGYGKPLVLALNKVDLLSEQDRLQLETALRQRYLGVAHAVVGTRSGAQERFDRILSDGRREQVTRDSPADVALLRNTLMKITHVGAAGLEPAREQAVLTGLDRRIGEAERDLRASLAKQVVDRYTRRAVIGALAAVAPGTDLLIQGALATGLIRELARIHAVAVRDIDLDGFLAQAALNLRTSASIVLAIAGNALKAFPGLGTLGGGVMHAVAYGLIFDSMGRAVAESLAEQNRFDREHATATMQRLLGAAQGDRLRHIAEVAVNALRDQRDAD
ncbi:MAG: GTPase domain-containing protein [Tahibacter sp.]